MKKIGREESALSKDVQIHAPQRARSELGRVVAEELQQNFDVAATDPDDV
jgi:hypothetical protein